MVAHWLALVAVQLWGPGYKCDQGNLHGVCLRWFLLQFPPTLLKHTVGLIWNLEFNPPTPHTHQCRPGLRWVLYKWIKEKNKNKYGDLLDCVQLVHVPMLLIQSYVLHLDVLNDIKTLLITSYFEFHFLLCIQ